MGANEYRNFVVKFPYPTVRKKNCLWVWWQGEVDRSYLPEMGFKDRKDPILMFDVNGG